MKEKFYDLKERFRLRRIQHTIDREINGVVAEHVLSAAIMHESDPRLVELASRILDDTEGTREERISRMNAIHAKLSLSQRVALIRIQKRMLDDDLKELTNPTRE